jgi:flagellar biosynthetic protein FliQ
MLDLSQALDLGREALLVSLIVAGPILLTGVVVGLIISLIQTVTQLQDQTFALVPKIVAMFAAAILFVPWLANRLIEYTQDLFTST